MLSKNRDVDIPPDKQEDTRDRCPPTHAYPSKALPSADALLGDEDEHKAWISCRKREGGKRQQHRGAAPDPPRERQIIGASFPD